MLDSYAVLASQRSKHARTEDGRHEHTEVDGAQAPQR